MWVRGPLKSKSIELHGHRKRFLTYAPISNYMKNVRDFQFFMDKYFMLNKKDCFMGKGYPHKPQIFFVPTNNNDSTAHSKLVAETV